MRRGWGGRRIDGGEVAVGGGGAGGGGPAGGAAVGILIWFASVGMIEFDG